MLKKEKEKEVMRLFILLLKKTKLYQDYVSVIKSKGSLSLKGLISRITEKDSYCPTQYKYVNLLVETSIFKDWWDNERGIGITQGFNKWAQLCLQWSIITFPLKLGITDKKEFSRLVRWWYKNKWIDFDMLSEQENEFLDSIECGKKDMY